MSGGLRGVNGAGVGGRVQRGEESTTEVFVGRWASARVQRDVR